MKPIRSELKNRLHYVFYTNYIIKSNVMKDIDVLITIMFNMSNLIER